MATFTNDEVVIITGASSGIGAGTAVKFAETGVKKFCLAALESSDTTMQACINASGGVLTENNFIIIVGDLTDEAIIRQIVDSTINKFGSIHILLNVAGVLRIGPLESTSLQILDSLLNVNVRALVALTQLCIPHLKQTKGSVVNVSSLAGIKAVPNFGFYCMSKVAVDMFTKCLALELAEHGVRVNAVNPAMVGTNILATAGLNHEQRDEVLNHAKNVNPLGRTGEVSEVANVIAFLASSQASYMTGNVTLVDGGRNIA